MELSNAVLPAVVFFLMLSTKSKAALNCTTPTSSCPQTETEWKERENLFNCGMQRYTCLLTEDNDLVEVCMWNSRIKDRMIGCPFIAHCDEKYGPILISEDKYSLCPEHLDGCPDRNHTGYHVSEIHKYHMCLTVDRSSSDIKFSVQLTTLAPSENIKVSSQIIIIVVTVISTVAVVTAFFVSLKYRSKCCPDSKQLKNVVIYKSVQTA